MSTGAKFGIAILASFLAVVIGVIGTYISAANYGNTAENNIKAAYSDNQNVLGQYTLKVQEAASVPAMYKDDLKDVVTSALSARYGQGGSQAVMQWIKENNIPFDSTLYAKVQQIVESGRNEFQNKQTRLIDLKRSYETNLGYVWKGFWLRLAGYPKINLNDYNIVLAEDTAEIFKNGKQSPIKLR